MFSIGRIWRCVVLLGWVLAAPWTLAQGFESVMAPGKLSQAHAKYDDDCAQCHVRFKRQEQSRLCLDCHKETRADVNAHAGYHGKMKQQDCRECHTEHQGRDMRLYTLDKKQFDHALTDYPLKAKHQKVECEKCHVAGKLYRKAPDTCVACHRKDDKHKGSLGDTCADCHDATSWKDFRYDHGKTKFALSGKHVDTKCEACHLKGVYKDTPKTCFACHQKDDEQKGHKGHFGEKCETCHGAKAWKTTTFNHDLDTKYVLNGKHRSVKCTACHTADLYKVKTSKECYACHSKDDKHKESLGRDCAKCHAEKSWKESPGFDHAKSDFPLLGKHTKVACKSCHEGTLYKQASKECVACHRKDDKHAANLGEKCAECHTDNDWKASRFDHDKTRFRLKNAHKDAKLKCDSCHKDVKSFRNTALECVACHKKDDKHEGQVGTQCAACHTDLNWKIARFDHNRTRFALVGRHLLATCKNCHETPRYRDARRDCTACHLKEDTHKQTLGVRCETCHTTRGWKLWDFDHDTATRYRLEGAHRTVACASCHRDPAPVGMAAAPLTSNCSTCHRSTDPHQGRFGLRCQQCHTTQSWKTIKNP